MAMGTGVLARLGGMLASPGVVTAASIYSVADRRRIPLDQHGFHHVRTAGPETGPAGPSEASWWPSSPPRTPGTYRPSR
jgi:hypothetical protein